MKLILRKLQPRFRHKLVKWPPTTAKLILYGQNSTIETHDDFRLRLTILPVENRPSGKHNKTPTPLGNTLTYRQARTPHFDPKNAKTTHQEPTGSPVFLQFSFYLSHVLSLVRLYASLRPIGERDHYSCIAALITQWSLQKERTSDLHQYPQRNSVSARLAL